MQLVQLQQMLDLKLNEAMMQMSHSYGMKQMIALKLLTKMKLMLLDANMSIQLELQT